LTPVIVGGIYRLPRRRNDSYDSSILFPPRACREIAHLGPRPLQQTRPQCATAATAVGFTPAEETLKSITLYPAQILGVADRVGSGSRQGRHVSSPTAIR
jgi:hypothetical protein